MHAARRVHRVEYWDKEVGCCEREVLRLRQFPHPVSEYSALAANRSRESRRHPGTGNVREAAIPAESLQMKYAQRSPRTKRPLRRAVALWKANTRSPKMGSAWGRWAGSNNHAIHEAAAASKQIDMDQE